MAESKDWKLTQEELTDRVEKLRPFLQQGQSLRMACTNAGVPKTSTYDYYNSDPDFADKIDRIMLNVKNIYAQGNYQQLLIIGNKLARIAKIHNDYLTKVIDEHKYLEDMEKWKLSPEEDRMWKWLAEHHPSLKDEYSMRSELTGKDGESLIPQDLAQPKVVETALRALEFLVDKAKQPSV